MENKSLPIPDRSTFDRYPQNVGIIAIDTYFPKLYCAQEDLEKFDGVSAGKYTIGLGQQALAFCNDREDIYSISLSAVANVMEKYNLSYTDIGRLEVATETIVDHSKSIKTVLMQLFTASGNTDVEGIDSMNACYAGTNALFNSVAWIESSAWDGRYAMVVCADIAEYAKGPARPTGGCGAVVFVIGPNAPVAIERGCRASHMEHVYDFYKPNLSSPYPVVDGHYSNVCYLRALDTCYERFTKKYARVHGKEFDLSACDHIIFHAPYNKLVQKSFARLVYNDFKRKPSAPAFKDVQSFDSVAKEASYSDRALEKAFVKLSKDDYATKVAPSTLLPRHLGNLYTGSLYAGLLSLLSEQNEALAGKRVLMFSYGSGLAASMFSIQIPDTPEARTSLKKVHDLSAIQQRLAKRKRASPEDFNKHMDTREVLHVKPTYQPNEPLDDLFQGAFYLTTKDDKARREYKRVSPNSDSRFNEVTVIRSSL